MEKIPIGSMYGIYANIGGILMVNVTISGIHGSYGIEKQLETKPRKQASWPRGGWVMLGRWSCQQKNGYQLCSCPLK